MLKTLKKTVFKIPLALAIVLLSGWLIVHNWQHRSIFHEQYAFTAEEAKKFKNFSEVFYVHGLNAWFQNNSDAAANFFRQAILKNVFYMDAWLRLAQAEIALANPDKAKAILKLFEKSAPIAPLLFLIYSLRRGSKASRSPSPRKMKARVVTERTIAGTRSWLG